MEQQVLLFQPKITSQQTLLYGVTIVSCDEFSLGSNCSGLSQAHLFWNNFTEMLDNDNSTYALENCEPLISVYTVVETIIVLAVLAVGILLVMQSCKTSNQESQEGNRDDAEEAGLPLISLNNP